MGKRKKATKPQGTKKKGEPLPTNFQCLFCNHEKSVTVKLYKKEGFGLLDCRICGQTYQTGINYLSHGVDVYTDWIDACDAVANKEDTDRSGAAEEVSRQQPAQRSMAPRAIVDEEDDPEMDDFIENDEEDAEAAYTGTMA